MKIWIDGYEANVKQRLGSSKVAFELIKNFEKLDRKNEYTILLPDQPLDDMPREREGWIYKILKPKKLWTKIALPFVLYMSKEKADLFFSPTHYIPRFSPIKRIVTIFDLSFLHFPQMFLKKDLWQLTNGTRFSVENANHIITISNFSKKDIIKNYNIRKNKITVAYPGYDKKDFKVNNEKTKINSVQKKYGINNNYIIYIGTVQPRKNLIRLIEAVSRIKDLNLVIVGKIKGEGKEGWLYKETLETPKSLDIEDRIKFLGFVPKEELPLLISGAKAFVMPSLWEGFGIPVLEAMVCGTPVIVSNVSSLPEIVGKAGLLIDPYSVDQIEQAIRVLVTDKKIHQKYAKLGLLRAKKFSWDKMAKEVLKTFESFNNSH
jgi:glycosyltransferase involved in cell wall biosynthesis